MNKIAQINFGPLRGIGDIGLQNAGKIPFATSVGILSRILSITVGTLSVIASIWFLFKIITGGLSIISAGGDKGKVAEARADITNGLIGLLVVLTATIFIGLIGTILGINFLYLSDLIDRLRW